RPLTFQDGILVLIYPGPFVPEVLDEVGFSSHTEAFQQSDGVLVFAYHESVDTVQAEGAEDVVEEGRDGFGGVALALVLSRQGIADLGLAGFFGVEFEGAVPDELACLL